MDEISKKPLMDLKEFLLYTGFSETFTRRLIKRPRNGFAMKLDGKWYIHKTRFDAWLLEKCDEY